MKTKTKMEMGKLTNKVKISTNIAIKLYTQMTQQKIELMIW